MEDPSGRPEPSKTARLLDLVAYLAGRRFPVSGQEVMETLPAYRDSWVLGDATQRASVKRKFERDKADLKELGIPLRSENPQGWSGARSGGDEEVRYQLRPGDFYLPAIRLISGTGEGEGSSSGTGFTMTPGEHRLAVEGLQHILEMPSFPLRRAGRRALRKLTFDLSPELEPEAPAILHLPAFDPVEVQEVLQVVSQAVMADRLLQFRYYAIGRDQETDRTVHPQGLLYQGARWYLVAWDPEREGERLFRVDRMSGVQLGPAADAGAGPGRSMAHLREREAWELGDESEDLRVRVRFRYPLSLLAARNEWGELALDGGREGDERVFQLRSPGPFVRWILSHAGDAVVLDPPELAQEVKRLQGRILEVHR